MPSRAYPLSPATASPWPRARGSPRDGRSAGRARARSRAAPSALPTCNGRCIRTAPSGVWGTGGSYDGDS